jgi:hypothetical protein
MTTDDPPGREEADRREHLHALERWAARQPREDPVHVLRIRLRDQPGAGAFYLARWSLVARLRRDAAGSGDELADLGPDTQGIARRLGHADIGPGDLIPVPRGEEP